MNQLLIKILLIFSVTIPSEMPTALKLGTSEKFKAMTFYTRTCNTNLRIQFPRYFLSIFFNHFSNIRNIFSANTREKIVSYNFSFFFENIYFQHLFTVIIQVININCYI